MFTYAFTYLAGFISLGVEYFAYRTDSVGVAMLIFPLLIVGVTIDAVRLLKSWKD